MKLDKPIEEKKVATDVVITAFLNRIEEGRIDIEYMLLTEELKPLKRGMVSFRGHNEAKELFAELDLLISDGKSFEEASRELLFGKVIGNL